jgi:hypothetical protein
MFKEADGSWSIRRVVFFGSFVFSAGICLLGLKYHIPETIEHIILALIAAASATMGAGRFAEALENRKQ